MELVVLLIVLGAAAYLFLKSNTKRGVETVRAAIFLWGKEAGVTVGEANNAANTDIANLPPSVIRDAIAYLRTEYGGKQLPMIAQAYRDGMTPKLPLWYRSLAGLSTESGAAFHTEQTQRPAPFAPGMERGQLSYEAYEQEVVAEAKRLDGKSAADLHWIELVDHEGTRRAYTDGIDPKALAAAILKIGMPPPVL